MICPHKAEESKCVVAECRARGLETDLHRAIAALRRLVEVGDTHEDFSCPQDDTCECVLAGEINKLLSEYPERKAEQA